MSLFAVVVFGLHLCVDIRASALPGMELHLFCKSVPYTLGSGKQGEVNRVSWTLREDLGLLVSVSFHIWSKKIRDVK